MRLFALLLALALPGTLVAQGSPCFDTFLIPVGRGPAGIGLNDTTNLLYVANSSSQTVSVIDTATDAVVATIPIGGSPLRVGVNPATNRAYDIHIQSGVSGP